MPIERPPMRTRSDAELAFAIMRALTAARLLWARGAELPVDGLAPLVDAPPDEIVRAVDGLCAEGMAERGASGATVRLTEYAVRELVTAGVRFAP